MFQIGYLIGVGIKYNGRIQKIAKSTDKLRPIYEAFTNSFEAINALNRNLSESKITIGIHFLKNLYTENNKDLEFDSITIEDNGVGFNSEEFERFLNLDDISKGKGNKGSGRIQFIHYFEKAEYESVYKDTSSKNGFKNRKFTLSKNDDFLQNNAIVRLDSDEETSESKSYSKLKLSNPLDKKDREFYKTLTVEELKDKLKNKFIALLCENRDILPEINIQKTVNGIIESSVTIKKNMIPTIDKKQDIEIHYLKFNSQGKIETVPEFEILNLKGFKINQNELAKNSIRIVNKGEIAKEIHLDSIAPDDKINNSRYLFLLSGELINNAGTDTRGELYIPSIDDFKKSQGEPDLFPEAIITIDEIKETTNETIRTIYPEIVEHAKETQIKIESLREMFLINQDTIKEAKIRPIDDEETALEKIYTTDSKLIAQKDIEIKKRIDALNQLTPNRTDYQDKLKQEVKELTKVIPLQNRTSLTQYVARRKLVLELFQKILDKEIEKLKAGGRIDEDILHNLIFQQTSNKPEESDLWLIGEEFIYFEGVSEHKLKDIEYKGARIFDKDFSEEDKRYLNSLGEKRLMKRPDILLFPEEGKCIIIELKAPDINASEYISQIDIYASLIRNYTIDDIQITTFYGYLIGEDVEDRDVRGRVSRFEHSLHLDYWFRPSEKVIGFDRVDGSIYTEVIKYSTLLKRSQLRNKIFIEKLDEQRVK